METSEKKSGADLGEVFLGVVTHKEVYCRKIWKVHSLRFQEHSFQVIFHNVVLKRRENERIPE
jgi:hypothetical protein